MKNSRSRESIKSYRFYLALLDMKGDGFALRAKRDILRTRLLAALFLAIGIASYFFVEGLWGHLTLALACAAAGACAAIDGGIGKRLSVWPYFDQVVDWPTVEEKSRENS